jgi:hypothetical protein
MPTIAELKKTSAYKNHKSIRGQPKSKMKKKELEKLVEDYYKKKKAQVLPQVEKRQPKIEKKIQPKSQPKKKIQPNIEKKDKSITHPEKLPIKDLKKTKEFLNYPNLDKKFFTKEQILTFIFNQNQDFINYFKVKNLEFEVNHLYSKELNSEKKERIEKYNFCKKKVDDILKNKDKWKVCISGPSKLEKNLQYLGKGSFGIVNKFIEDNCEIVVKEIGLRNQDFIQITKKHFLTEFTLLKTLTEDVNFCFFIPMLYGIGFCNSCKQKMCSVFFMEVFDSSAESIPLTDKISVSCVFMILDALWYLEKKYGFIHYDIKLMNVLVKKDFSKEGSQLFTQFPEVRNQGYTFYLSDFGISWFTRPNKVFETKYGYFEYGQRLVEIKKNQTNLLYASPLAYQKTSHFSKIGVDLVPTTRINWHAEDKPIIHWNNTSLLGTRNFFSSKFSIQKMDGPEIDLNDMEKYPSLEFLDDICDVFKMFLGGKRSTQPGNHSSILISKRLRDIFENWNIPNSVKFIYNKPDIERIYLFRADIAQTYFYNLLHDNSYFDNEIF